MGELNFKDIGSYLKLFPAETTKWGLSRVFVIVVTCDILKEVLVFGVNTIYSNVLLFICLYMRSFS